MASFVKHYNTVRLHSAIGYLTPADKLAGRQEVIFQKRDQKLAAARELRRQRRADAVQADDGAEPPKQPAAAEPQSKCPLLSQS